VTCDIPAPGENAVILDPLRYFLTRPRPHSGVVLARGYRARMLGVAIAARARRAPPCGLAAPICCHMRPHDLTDAEFAALADRLAPLIAERLASPPGLLTPHEAARRTGTHVETIRRAVRTGALPASRAGRAVRIDADDLDRWLRVDHGARSHAGRRLARPRAARRRPLADALARP
jgi:excisionase family DNA binding protein